MAAQAGLSIAANAFAVVGLADVVFRAGKDVIELLFKIHDAPAALSSLIDAVRVLEGAIAETRSYISDLAASDFVSVDHAVVPDIVFLLQKCQHEFNHLSLLTTATATTPQDGWKLLWKKKAVFALNEKEIERAQRKLERYTQALNTIVLASEGKNQVLLRNQMSSTRKDLAQSKAEVLQQVASSSEGVRATIMKSIDDIHHAIQASTVDVHAALELESSKIGTSLQNVAGMVEDSRNKTLMESKATEKLIATTSELLRLGIDAQQTVLKTSVTGLLLEQRHRIDSVHRDLQRAHSQQLSATSRQLRESKRQGHQLNRICGTLMHMASIDVRESANGITEIVGLNMEELLLPLLLVKSQVAKIIPSLIREGQLILSTEELRWLQGELAALIREAKSSQYGSTEMNARDHHNPKREKKTSSHRSLSADTGSRHVSSSMLNTKDSRTVHSFSTPAGTVCLTMTRKVGQCAHDGSRSTDVMTTVQFAFIPRLELCDVGFTAFFSRQEETTIRHRQWRGYKILPANSEVFEIIRNDDAQALQDMIRQRKIFPSDCTTRGQSLAHMAMMTGSLKAFELLIDSGGRIEYYTIQFVHAEPRLSRDALEPHSPRLAWQAIAYIFYIPDEFRRWQHTLSRAFGAGLNVSSVFASQSSLSPARCESFEDLLKIAARVDEDVVWTDQGHYSTIAEICQGCMGCDNPAHSGYSMLSDLISLSVDVNSTDKGGQNALHKLCSSTYPGTSTTRCSHPLSALYRARSIRLLLDAGCDPLSLDAYGQSPNDIAGMDIRRCAIFKSDIGPDCLDIWARTSFHCVGLPFPNRFLEALDHLGHCLMMSSDLVTSMGIAYPHGFADFIQCSNLLCKDHLHVTRRSTEPPQSAGPPMGMVYPWFKSSQICALDPFRPQYALCMSVVERILNLLTCGVLSLKRARKNPNAQEPKMPHQAPEPLLRRIEAGVETLIVELFALSDSPWYDHEVQGWNLLTAAAKVNYTKLVKFLIEKGGNADVRTPDVDQSMISIAAQSWSYEMVLLLLDKGANPNVNSLNENIQSPLISAIVRGDRRMAALLLRYGASPMIEGSRCGLEPGDPLQPLSLAAKYSDTRMLELLLETGAAFGQDDLAIATRYGHPEAVEFLLEQGADSNRHPLNNSLPHPLVSAMKRGDKRMAMILLNHGARPDTSSNVSDLALWLLAVEAADTEMSRTWRGTRVNLLHELLACATGCSSCETVQTLLEKRADPNLYPRSLQSPLASAVIRQDPGMVEMLLDYGASTATLMNENSTTPSALEDGLDHFDIVKVLLEHSGTPNMHLRDALGLLKILVGHGSSKIVAASLLDHIPFLSDPVSSKAFHNALFLAAFDRRKLSSWLPDANHMEYLESNALEAELDRYNLIELLVERRADIDSQYLAHACRRATIKDDYKVFAILLKFDAWRACPADLAVTNVIDGETLDEILHRAIVRHARDSRFVEILLESGIYPDCQFVHDTLRTPLGVAITLGYIPTAAVLLSHGANVNLPWGNPGTFPLDYSIQVGNYDMVKLLLENGADSDLLSKRPGDKLLDKAARTGDQDMCKLLLDRAGYSDHSMAFPIRRAVDCGNQGICKLFLDHGADPNRSDGDLKSYPLSSAVRNRNQDMCELLLNHGACPNLPWGRINISLLMYAVIQHDQDMCRLLLLHGADPNFLWINPLLGYPIEYEDRKTFKLLLGEDEYPDGHWESNPSCALEAAAILWELDISAIFPAKDTRPNRRWEPNASCALESAAKSGDYILCKLLLDYGADINLPTTYPTAIEYAASSEDHFLCGLLLHMWDKPEPSGYPKAYALTYAAWCGDRILCKLLLDEGVDLDPPLELSETSALGYAIQNRDHVLCEMLLEHGADPNLPWGNRQTYALDHAAWHGDYRLCKLLLEHGADPDLEFDSWICSSGDSVEPFSLIEMVAGEDHDDIAELLAFWIDEAFAEADAFGDC